MTPKDAHDELVMASKLTLWDYCIGDCVMYKDACSSFNGTLGIVTDKDSYGIRIVWRVEGDPRSADVWSDGTIPSTYLHVVARIA